MRDESTGQGVVCLVRVPVQAGSIWAVAGACASSAHLHCQVLGMEHPFKAEPPVHTKVMLLPTSHARSGALQMLGNRGSIRPTIIHLSLSVEKNEVQTIF